MPILQTITNRYKKRRQEETSNNSETGGKALLALKNAEFGSNASFTDFEKSLDDNEVYREYSDVVLRSFPFAEIISEIQDLLSECGLKRLVAFFDDFSELNFLDQRLFVDVILAPLNNSTNEAIKLKIAGYPGRVYYGRIDPAKVDTITLDFSNLYEANEIQTMEQSAIDYTFRLLNARFEAFDERIEDYFDTSATIEEHMRLLFETTFNVPRLMGTLLHICYLDRVSKELPVNQSSLRLASQKHYESTLGQYFDRLNRFALEPFENKLDRHNQKELLQCISKEARGVRKRIDSGEIGGTYFSNLKTPPTSHFTVKQDLESVFQSLESNFLVSKYKDTRDKDGNPVTVYALYYGLIETERLTWGYPSGREYRNYFVQRCFNHSATVHSFLSENQTIRCNSCGKCYPLDQKASFELFKWRCPECQEGLCTIVNLAEDFSIELQSLEQGLMLEPIELEILNILSRENRLMRAGEISALIDVTYQLVGKRTSKLQEMGLVDKVRDSKTQKMKSKITNKAGELYF